MLNVVLGSPQQLWSYPKQQFTLMPLDLSFPAPSWHLPSSCHLPLICLSVCPPRIAIAPQKFIQEVSDNIACKDLAGRARISLVERVKAKRITLEELREISLPKHWPLRHFTTVCNCLALSSSGCITDTIPVVVAVARSR